MTRYAMAIDVGRCLGCQACLVACKAENEVPDDRYRLRMRETVVGRFPDLIAEICMEQCYHCDDPPCVPVCPTGATYQTDEGLVLIDPDKCTGCKACVTACPYNMRYVHPGGWVDKCTFCDHRLAEGRLPACVETCPTGARVFGDLEDVESPVSLAIDAARSVAVATPSTGADPHLFYLNSALSHDHRESEVSALSEIGT
jgi:Fe-S-cluster-containing dehydrogenase component